MGFSTVSVCVDVDVDIDDVKDEVLDDLTNDELLELCEDRGLIGSANESIINEPSLQDVKEVLCDLFSMNHHTEWEVLFKKIKEQ